MSNEAEETNVLSTSRLSLQDNDAALSLSASEYLNESSYLNPHEPEFHSVQQSNDTIKSPERPKLRLRSFTTPINDSFRRFTAQSTSKESQHSGPRPHHREWSVFAQTMKNGGQLNAPRSVRLRRSFISSDGHGTPNSPALHTSQTMHASTNSIVQSPVEESASPIMTDRNSIHTEHEQEPPDYDSEDSDNDSESDSDDARTVQPTPKKGWALTPLQRNIIKCATAYFIGSLFTYVPALSHLLSDITSAGSGYQKPSPSAHMVATVAVYYNPAKTVGAMLEADLFCLFGLAWASLICIGGMSMFWWLDVQPGWEWLADTLVLLWVGLGMTAVAFMKIWMNKPSFSSACSMTAIILFIVIVREGTAETLLQVACIVAIGAFISNIICHILWPESAGSKLQDNMTETLDSFRTLLLMLTNTFLLGDSSSLHQPSQGRLQRAVDSHQRSFTSLKKNLEEARSEWLMHTLNSSQSKKVEALEDAVDSLNRLAQHLNGMRSGTRLQYELTKAERDGKIVLKHANVDLRKRNTLSRNLDGEEDEEDDSDKQKGKYTSTPHSQAASDENATLQAAARIFGDLVDELGPPLNALTGACADTLHRLREIFSQNKTNLPRASYPYQNQEFFELTDEIERALYTFESTANYAIMRVYRRSGNMSAAMSFASLASDFYDNESDVHKDSKDHETVFLVYFFIFTLQEFAHELVSLVDALGRVHAIESAITAQGSQWNRWKSFVFKLFQRRDKDMDETARRRGSRPQTLGRRLSLIMSTKIRHQPAKFPKVQPHAPNTIQTPSMSELSFFGKIQQSIWRLRAILKQRNVKYAIKAGMATALLAAPGFAETTRPIFVEYRGEWALISFFVVISPTIGATNFLSLHRILGTLLGAITAVTVFICFNRNPIALAIFGFFFSMPCFYYIVSMPQYATSGRFVLLTYNLTCLYCYNVRHSDVSVTTVAFHRATAVTVGVLWAGLVSRFWWPAEARRELSNALSEFCLNIGWLFSSLVRTNFKERSQKREIEDLGRDESAETVVGRHYEGDDRHGHGRECQEESSRMLLPKDVRPMIDDAVRDLVAMELHLQVKLIEMQGLLAQTKHEPRLKGPFPVKLYRSILTSLQTILDKLHSMRCVTTREEWFTSVRQDFVLPVIKEQREMVGNVVLYFSVLSAAFKLKAPLPPYMPPAERSRQRLVNSIRRLPIVRSRSVKGSRHLLFFAYALTMKSVTHELNFLGRTLKEAFGVIGGAEEMIENEEEEGWRGEIV